MSQNRFRVVPYALALGGIAAIAGHLAFAGPLNPPAGPVAGTYKTLTEVEPRIAINAVNTPGDAGSLFKISQPGSYYLTGNITGVAGKHGIRIAASGVSIDLSGFDVAGVPAMGSFDGITINISGPEGPLTNITVKNGSVRNWGGDGIDLNPLRATGGQICDITASGNAGRGISNSDTSVTSNCTAAFNGQEGIAAGRSSSVLNCAASDNGAGFLLDLGCAITNCSARLNLASGIECASSCTVDTCSATTNSGHGIKTSAGSAIVNCSASGNTLGGIFVSERALVTGCTVDSNGQYGIETASDCSILGNHCQFNGGTPGGGIGIGGSGNVVDGNTLVKNRYGINVFGTHNLIVRNNCKSSVVSNFDIAPNNNYGAIVNRTTGTTPLASGNSAPSTLTTTDPHANFAY